MRTLFNAPATSPLSEIDTNNVAELFVELTRANTQTQVHTQYRFDPYSEGCVTGAWYDVCCSFCGFQGTSVHESLAVRVCNEILRDTSAPEVRLYCKTLGSLEISADPGPANDELQQLLTSILQVTLHTRGV